MRRLVLVLLTALTFGCGGMMPIASVAYDYPTIVLLSDLGKQFEHETAMCLLGYRVGDELTVNALRAVQITAQDSVSVAFVACDEDNRVVGWYHNHPGLADNCYPSAVDLDTMARNPAFKITLISCADAMRPAFVYVIRGDRRLYRITPAMLDSLAQPRQP